MSWTDPRANEGADPMQDKDPEDLDDVEAGGQAAELDDTSELEPQEEE